MSDLLQRYEIEGLISAAEIQSITQGIRLIQKEKVSYEEQAKASIVKGNYQDVIDQVEYLKKLQPVDDLLVEFLPKEHKVIPYTVEQRPYYGISDMLSGKKPSKLCYLDHSTHVTSWSELYVMAVTYLVYTNPLVLTSLAQRQSFKGGDTVYMSNNPLDIKNPIQIEAYPIYIDANVSAIRACQRLQKICGYCAMDGKEFKIYITG